MSLQSFLAEMKRRRVWRVAGAYVVVMWMTLEIALTSFDVFGFPHWVSTLAVLSAFLGFPVAMTLAWAFDITPQGVVRTPAAVIGGEGAGGGAAADAASVEAPGSAGSGAVVVHAAPSTGRLVGVFGVGILVALMGFGAYAHYGPGRTARTTPAEVQSLAVLPFLDLSAAQDQGYFTDGVTEELLNRLARVPELRVAGRTSSFAFKGTTLGIKEIGQRLSVDAVLEGSVRRDGDRVRVTAQLTDVASGFELWSETYDRAAGGILEIQDEIAHAIVDELRLQLSPSGAEALVGTESVKAHDDYLLGLARWHRRTAADLEKALAYFQRAAQEDPNYALAYAGLAQTYAVLPFYADVVPSDAAAKANAAAARALALDAHLAEAHAALGQIAQALEWDLPGAETSYRRALEFNPGYATAHQWYAETLLMMGRLRQAHEEIDRALALDPLSPAAQFTKAYLLSVEHDYATADTVYDRLLRRAPDFVPGWTGRLMTALAAGNWETARQAVPATYADAAVRAAVQTAVDGVESPARHAAGVAALDSLGNALPSTQRGLLYAALGANDRALRMVEQAFVEAKDPNLPFYLVHPVFDGIRDLPRFRAVADALGTEAPAALDSA
ncbi:MAG: tetratricopeptide repeat protein [Gemmatimonadota bacterium]